MSEVKSSSVFQSLKISSSEVIGDEQSMGSDLRLKEGAGIEDSVFQRNFLNKPMKSKSPFHQQNSHGILIRQNQNHHSQSKPNFRSVRHSIE